MVLDEFHMVQDSVHYYLFMAHSLTIIYILSMKLLLKEPTIISTFQKYPNFESLLSSNLIQKSVIFFYYLWPIEIGLCIWILLIGRVILLLSLISLFRFTDGYIFHFPSYHNIEQS